MAIVVCKCDTCKRTIELPVDRKGLETLGRCQITLNCKGFLVRERVLTMHTVGRLPTPDSTGLVDYSPRKVFYKFTQELAYSTWSVVHNLHSVPDVTVFVDDGAGNLVETSNYTLTVIDANSISIVFADPKVGVVHCISRTSGSAQTQTSVAITDFSPRRVSYGNSIAIATDIEGPMQLTVKCSHPIKQTQLEYEFSFTLATNTHTSSPWRYVQRIYDNGGLFYVYSFDISAILMNPILTDGYIVRIVDIKRSDSELRPSASMILLARDPYGVVDRVHDSYVPGSTIAGDTAGAYISQGALYTPASDVKYVYPHLKVV